MASESEVGHRLLVTLIDQYAAAEPPPVWAVVPIDDFDLSKGFKDITFRELANSINIAVTWLHKNLPTAKHTFETIAYAGPKDIRYVIFAVAAAKLKRKLLLPSPMASAAAQSHLIRTSDCRVFLHAAPLADTVGRLLSGQTRTIASQVPELSAFLWQSTADAFPYKERWDEVKDDPWLIFHTSGTTGLPKLVTYSQQAMSSLDSAELMLDAEEQTMNRHFEGGRWYTPLPSLHFVGMTVALQFPVFIGAVVVVGPTTPGPPNPQITSQVLRYSKAQGALFPPALIDALCDDPEGLACLRNLEYLYFAGAPLSARTAAKLIDHVAVKPAMGSTEAGAYFLRVSDKEDWEYYSFRPAMGVTFELATDTLYEMIFVRRPELERWQQIFRVFPELDEYRTKDLFARHPTKPDYWKYVGRTDDMVPFSHGDNLYVADLEALIVSSHTGIAAALIGGQGRPRPYLLVEWKDGIELDDSGKMDALKSIVDKVNERCSEPVRLGMERVLFTKKGKGLVRTVKGSVARRESEALYRKEIEGLYL